MCCWWTLLSPRCNVQTKLRSFCQLQNIKTWWWWNGSRNISAKQISIKSLEKRILRSPRWDLFCSGNSESHFEWWLSTFPVSPSTWNVLLQVYWFSLDVSFVDLCSCYRCRRCRGRRGGCHHCWPHSCFLQQVRNNHTAYYISAKNVPSLIWHVLCFFILISCLNRQNFFVLSVKTESFVTYLLCLIIRL